MLNEKVGPHTTAALPSRGHYEFALIVQRLAKLRAETVDQMRIDGSLVSWRTDLFDDVLELQAPNGLPHQLKSYRLRRPAALPTVGEPTFDNANRARTA